MIWWPFPKQGGFDNRGGRNDHDGCDDPDNCDAHLEFNECLQETSISFEGFENTMEIYWFLVAMTMIMIALQDTLISFEEFVQIMDASDVEHKMSMKFVG